MALKNKAPFFMKIKFCLPSKSSGNANALHVKYIAVEAEQVIESNMNSQASNAVLFGADGIEDTKGIQKELRKHDGVVWRFILSLREDDAKRLGHNAKEDWERVIRLSIPGVASGMGIGLANLKWAAAFHDAKDHPHVHLMVWENEPKILRGLLDDKELKNVRRAFMNEFYGEARWQMMLERTLYRNSMRESARESAILAKGIRPRQ